ncbi:DNA mismatch repair protein MutS [Rhodofomes roseus]|uniref:DNA mismatch repair protein MutS n=1 Tax=Rhodofomes roseus TaxID=34475 RepID=A0ABQ8KRM0_9APHY|nr:DNA mismatch repair protein MutS [Rhodofomes roseus]KAH9841446.1 DNA mismatch repair protein MutS [Rhodofomes roseus]
MVRLDKASHRTKGKEKRTRPDPSSDHEDNHDSSLAERPNKKVRWGNDLGTVEESIDDNTEEGTSNTPEKAQAYSVCSGRIGCAYYDPVKCTIYTFEDTPENQHYDLTKSLLEQCGPDMVITSSKADDSFMDVLRDHMDSSGGTFQVRPHKDFSAAKGRDRLLSLRLLSELPSDLARDMPSSESDSGSEPRNAYEFMRRRQEIGGDPTMQQWNASIRLANYASMEATPLCLGSVGALLDHLTRIRAVGDLDDEGINGLEVRAIEPLAPHQTMQINADALFSLQIFEDESHASIHSDKTKEGLSLFGILNNTKTTLGRALMREWLLRPSLSLSVIGARHDAVACFVRPDNQAAAGSMHSHLKGIKNVPRILGIMRAGKDRVSDWQCLVKFTFHSLMLRDAMGELCHAGHVEIVKKARFPSLEVASFREVGTAVNETIDWEESALAGRVCVRPHIDEELDNLKHIYNGIDSVLSRVAQQISETIPPDYASSLNVVYFPQLGFLICVPMLEEWKTDAGVQVLDGWTFQVRFLSHVYFKSQEMHDMDAHIGDLHPSIVDREIEIVQTLSERILVHAEAMQYACDVCAELDCLLSFAEASTACNFIRPQMVGENIIEIRQGRHPLQELVVDTFVPNDALLLGGCGVGVELDDRSEDDASHDGARDKNSIVVCTGANACGKSVYLKQIAMIQYMAQIGCFVPAECATLGIVDKIFTRVQTRESVSKVQSAFMIDLNQVSFALRNATERSLILLDEFGKGTMSSGSYPLAPTGLVYHLLDGAGLFCSVLKHLASRGSACPKVLAATHFHDVFMPDLLDPGSLPITFVHMQILLTSSSGHLLRASGAGDADCGVEDDGEEDGAQVAPGERITYLYRVAKGLSLDSHAAMCAEIFGIPRRVAQRAQYVSRLLATHELGQLLDEEMSDVERRDLEDAEEVCRRFLAWNFARDNDDDDDPDPRQDVRRTLAEVLGRQVE